MISAVLIDDSQDCVDDLSCLIKKHELPVTIVATAATGQEGDATRMQRHIELFLARIPESLEHLRQAMAGNNLEALRCTAHSMKPQLRMTGMHQGLELAESIELLCKEKRNLELLPQQVQELETTCHLAMNELKSMAALRAPLS